MKGKGDQLQKKKDVTKEGEMPGRKGTDRIKGQGNSLYRREARGESRQYRPTWLMKGGKDQLKKRPKSLTKKRGREGGKRKRR